MARPQPSLYLTCPAYGMETPLDRAHNVAVAEHIAKQLGWRLVVSPLMERYTGRDNWLPLKERQSDLRKALQHEAIWACRGGYGSIELVDIVLQAKVKQVPLLIGYSDITALHGAFAARGWHRHIYSAAQMTLIDGGRLGTSLVSVLRGNALTLGHQHDAGARVLRTGKTSGRLFPACLSVLTSLCGTKAMPSLAGCILAIEDIKVHPFLMATHLNQLALSGALRGVRGILGGTFTHAEEHDYDGPSPDAILAEWGARLKVPTIAGLPYGHLRDPYALPYHRTTHVDASSSGRWTITISAGR